jgi:hypothetical protein
MSLLRALPLIVAVVLVAGFAQAQTPARSAPRAPGVTRAVERPDSSSPDDAKPDARQPETAKDDQKMTPETARDDDKLKPETATDAPRKPSSRQSQRAAEIAKQGVRSNTPPQPPKQPKPQS